MPFQATALKLRKPNLFWNNLVSSNGRMNDLVVVWLSGWHFQDGPTEETMYFPLQ